MKELVAALKKSLVTVDVSLVQSTNTGLAVFVL